MTSDLVSIRCLSLTQPWAHLVMHQRKQIETRTWRTPYRGKVLILSTKERSQRIDDLARYFHIDPKDLVYGHALCTAHISACRPMATGDYELALVDPEPGRFSWRLRSIERIAPFPMRGMQGLFTRQVERRLLAPICECVECCNGEHPGECKECAGWGERGGVECGLFDGDGSCTVCHGANRPTTPAPTEPAA